MDSSSSDLVRSSVARAPAHAKKGAASDNRVRAGLLSLVLLSGALETSARPAAAAILELPPPVETPRPVPPRTLEPPPVSVVGNPCNLEEPRLPAKERLRSCAGSARVDEIATIRFNTVLQRTCGQFVVHHRSGNAVLSQAKKSKGGVFDLVSPGLKAGSSGWVLALRGCGLDKIKAVEVGGALVSAKVIPASRIRRFLVPLSPTGRDSSPPSPVVGPGGDGLETAFVQFEVDAEAHLGHERPISVVFESANPLAGAQKLERIELKIAHNGSEDSESRSPFEIRWEEETEISFNGERLANARFTGPACVKESQVLSSGETSFQVRATFHCPVPVEGEPGVTVNDPRCGCAAIAYDGALDVYPELSKKPFNYFRTPLQIVANLDYLRQRPAVLGDSLAHGAFSGAVTERSQRWAYPHLIVDKMGGEPLTQNMIHAGPNLEDAIKSIVPARYGPAPLFLDLFPHHIGLLEDDVVILGEKTTTPTHAGVSGFDYSNVLRTSGICLDVEGRAERRSGARIPDQICGQRCEDADGNLLPSPSVDAQLALGCSDQTPIEMIEEIEPTFVFASAAANHALACTITTTTEGCLEWDRFERDSAEVFRRLRAISSIKGGVVFGIPPLSSIPYLVPHKPDEPCPDGTTQLRAFWKEEALVGPDEVLDCDERAQLDGFVAAVNARLGELAEMNRYAYADALPLFNLLSEQGVPIRDDQGDEICRARTIWPKRSIDIGPNDLAHPENTGNDAGCGIISLDGVHPSQHGHTIMANGLIAAINAYYRFEEPVPSFDDGELLAAWEFDDLAQDPIDMDDFMRLDFGEMLGEGVGVAACAAPAIVCAATNGLACLGAVEVEAILLATPVADICREVVARVLITELGFRPVDSSVEPSHCWDDHCPDAADATPD